ncbi:MAG: ABC transporter ATP-binding protein [Sporolactobacillus sp.]
MELTLKQLTLNFSEVTAVDSLSCAIHDGELVSLLGPSGCGKSSTLFMLAGLYQPTSGELLFDGKKVNAVEPERREIGMVFQNYALYPHMSVLKNIMFPLRMKKMGKREARERAIEAAELVQIKPLLERMPAQLSGGQQQRVAIARALVKRPRLLLLDEPLSNLDARLRISMRSEIRRIQQQVGITTIFVTHDQEEALSISDRILLMNQGQLQQFDTPQQVYRYPNNRFVAAFLGNPPINFLPVAFADGALRVLTASPDQSRHLTLGIRPEDCLIDQNAAGAVQGLAQELVTVGRDNLLTVDVRGHRLHALVDADQQLTAGQAVWLRPRTGRAVLFDADGKQMTEQWDGVLTDE